MNKKDAIEFIRNNMKIEIANVSEEEYFTISFSIDGIEICSGYIAFENLLIDEK